MKMKRIFFVLLVPLLLLSACGGGKGNEQLDKVDSLVTAEAFDSAYQTLMAIDKRDITTDADGSACKSSYQTLLRAAQGCR